MRVLTPEYSQFNFATSKNPMWVVAIEFADDGSDTVYFTSKVSTPAPPGTVVISNALGGISGTTQRIDPETGNSTIGSITVTLNDHKGTVTQVLNERDQAGVGVRQKTIVVYMGYEGMSWEGLAANRIQTSIIDDIEVNERVYTLQCADINRSVRKDIFELEKTNLRSSISATDLLIPVYSTTGFELLAHGNSFRHMPNRKVLYIKIDDEVICCDAVINHPVLGPCFVVASDGAATEGSPGRTGRGVFNTEAVEHLVNPESEQEQRPEVEEFVYLEMPAVKLIYALLTGNLYGQPGERLPDKWHLNIPGKYVRLADFLNAGTDVWDPSNDEGIVVRFAGQEKEDAKKFIETQLCLLMVASMPIYSNGELGFRRLTSILAEAPSIFTLNRTNIVSTGALRQDLRSVYNLLSIEWNYDFLKERTTRQRVLVDQESAVKHNLAPPKTLEFRGLHGSRHSEPVVTGMFNRLRDRFSNPPFRLEVQVLPSVNFLEVGDIVRVNEPSIIDPLTKQGLDRSFEIHQVKTNWVTGNVTLELFGSSAPATPISGGNSTSQFTLPDSAYEVGRSLAEVLHIEQVGGVGHVTRNGHIPGGSDLRTTIYHYPGDLEIDDGVFVTFDRNVQLRVRGHLQISGQLDGTGRGHPGAPAVPMSWPFRDYVRINEDPNRGAMPPDLAARTQERLSAHNPGTPGFIGPTITGGGIKFNLPPIIYQRRMYSIPPHVTEGSSGNLSYLNVRFENNQLIGLPADLQGTSGGSGHSTQVVYTREYDGDDNPSDFDWQVWTVPGGAGGASGAGLALVARGVSIAINGRIVSNGLPGQEGQWIGGHISMTRPEHNTGEPRLASGTGAAGAPGAVLIMLDGVGVPIPDQNDRSMMAHYGDSPIPSWATIAPELDMLRPSHMQWYSHYIGYSGHAPNLSGSRGAFRILPLPPTDLVDDEDLPVHAPAPSRLSLSEIPNFPRSPAGNLTTIEVTVTRPQPLEGYGWSTVYYRLKGELGWTLIGAASDETSVVVAADGSTYEFQARPVNYYTRIESQSGPIEEITILNLMDGGNNEDVDNNVPVVTVSGLHLVGSKQGKEFEFEGNEVTIGWRIVSIDRPDIGHEPIGGGAGFGAPDLWILDTEVRVYSGDGALLRTRHVAGTTYTYTYAMNVADSAAAGLPGPQRQLTFDLRTRGRSGQLSKHTARLVVSNPAPELPSGWLPIPGHFEVGFQFDVPTDADYKHVDIFMSRSSGFTPNEGTLVWRGASSPASVPGLVQGTSYFYRYRAVDDFGPGAMSGELQVITQSLSTGDIGDLEELLGQINYDDSAILQTLSEHALAIGQNASGVFSNSSQLNDPITGLPVTRQQVIGLASNVALITDDVSAHANAINGLITSVTSLDGVVNSLSAAVTNLSTTVGDHSTSITQTIASVDGINARYTVKIDANGAIAGYGLISTANDDTDDPNFSQFYINADRFVILPRRTSTGGGVAPFVVEGDQVWMSNALIRNLVAGQITSVNWSTVVDDDGSMPDGEGDSTKTVIDGGLITTGTIQLQDAGGTTLAGITAAGNGPTNVRFWAGSSYNNRQSAPYRVTQEGKLYALDGEFSGIITGSTITGGTFRTAAEGPRIEIQGGVQNQIELYGLNSFAGVGRLGYVGQRIDGASYAIARFGNDYSVSTAIILEATKEGAVGYVHNFRDSADARGLYVSTAGAGVGIYCTVGSGTGRGIFADGGAFGTGLLAMGSHQPLVINPSPNSGPPTHAATNGTFWVSWNGLLYLRSSGVWRQLAFA